MAAINPNLHFQFFGNSCLVTKPNGETVEIEFNTEDELNTFKLWVKDHRSAPEAPHHPEYSAKLQKADALEGDLPALSPEEFPRINVYAEPSIQEMLAKKLLDRGVLDVRVAIKLKDLRAEGIAMVVHTPDFDAEFHKAIDYCVENEIRVLSVFLDEENSAGIVGPFHQPQKSACPKCVHDEMPKAKVKSKEDTTEYKLQDIDFGEFRDKVFETAASELEFHFSGTGRLENGILNLDFDEIEPIHTPVAPNKKCSCQKKTKTTAGGKKTRKTKK
jgi:hypothetical protein